MSGAGGDVGAVLLLVARMAEAVQHDGEPDPAAEAALMADTERLLRTADPAHLRALAAQAEAGEGEKMRHALRNLQLLANQQLFRASRGRDTSEAWHTVKRFCEEGGMVSSPLRAASAQASAGGEGGA